MDLLKKRCDIVYYILGLLLIIELGMLFYNSGIVENLNERADILKLYAETMMDDATVLPGDIYDRNGNPLAVTEIKTIREDEEEWDTVVTTYTNSKAYAQLIGYTGAHLLYPFVNDSNDVVGQRLDYRLMAFLDEEYWTDQGLGIYSTADIDGTKGQSAVLTIDDHLQTKVYESLKSQMSETDDRGSAVVMNAKTGEILAMVAFPTYDFNHLSDAVEEMQQAENETNLEPGYPVSYKASVNPGSILKVLTAISLIENDMENFTVVDEDFEMNGWSCRNDYNSPGDTITYAEALIRSSNVFFAKAAMALGKDRINETAKKFLFCEDTINTEEDDTYISLDFGNVEYNWDLTVRDKNGEIDTDPEKNRILLAETGFGQGKAEMTTVTAAMMTQAIANGGKMMKPYLIQNLMDADGHIVYAGKPEILSTAASETSADKVAAAMEAAVGHSAYYTGNETVSAVFEACHVAGKTGTGQVGENGDENNAWFISFAPADDPQYVVVVNQCRTTKYGSELMTTAAEIYDYLFQN